MKRKMDDSLTSSKRVCILSSFEHVILGSFIVKHTWLSFLTIEEVLIFRGVNRNFSKIHTDITVLDIHNNKDLLWSTSSNLQFNETYYVNHSTNGISYNQLLSLMKTLNNEPAFPNVTTLRVSSDRIEDHSSNVFEDPLRIPYEQFPRLKYVSIYNMKRKRLYLDPRIMIHTIELKGCNLEGLIFNIKNLKVLSIDGNNKMSITIFALLCLFKHTTPSSLTRLNLENISTKHDLSGFYCINELVRAMFPDTQNMDHIEQSKHALNSLIKCCPDNCQIQTRNIQ